jgi:hypothetical protein
LLLQPGNLHVGSVIMNADETAAARIRRRSERAILSHNDGRAE